MNIDIGLCTYRRVHVAETLRSLARLALPPDWKIRVIVADNDDTQAARELIEKTARENALDLTYIHAPAHNISVARNACLDAATAPLLAFIDDDEIADPAWLKALAAALDIEQADAVLGPVRAIYGPDCPDWIIDGDYFSTNPVWSADKIKTGYCGNVLLRRTSPALQNLRFREELGRTGGEDSVFFAALYCAGGKIAYAPEAVVTEIVPAARANFAWLLRRRFRTGRTHGLMLLQETGNCPFARVKNILLASGKFLFCLLLAAPNLIRPARLRFWLLRGALHAGVVVRLMEI